MRATSSFGTSQTSQDAKVRLRSPERSKTLATISTRLRKSSVRGSPASDVIAGESEVMAILTARQLPVLSGDAGGNPRQYAISLEAKSKEKDQGKVAAGTVDIAAVIRHRDKFECQHALVVGRSFPTTQGEKSALAQDIADDRRKTKALNDPKTITLITIDDLAELVRLRPIKRIGLRQLRGLFECALPD